MNWKTTKSELLIRTSRASGAGGQHVNKTETKVELVFDVVGSRGLSDREKALLKQNLRKRIDANGIISVVDQSSRSQHTNRKRAYDRMERLLRKGLRPKPKEVKRKAFVANKRKRLERKKRQSEKKAMRGKRWM
ncbi:alternative ribosome rescue aminoacyl-tRNA hydrolase ArfB [Lewinella sp. W8]|uniref:alternative ribosome rescue aminoacyl-tRNA hydrolase ArfB n=1 Tax=Lewinella sp. W8 TaxID=2528208 RepID=UPI001067E013|nr:alternative ribosome rescue aminoacyl-tRNA hydrolase ArfB [Lewinella sp. W8]MTB53874.1 aminoacyl-tRNA hydrolase [Lewinella sp. W8]